MTNASNGREDKDKDEHLITDMVSFRRVMSAPPKVIRIAGPFVDDFLLKGFMGSGNVDENRELHEKLRQAMLADPSLKIQVTESKHHPALNLTSENWPVALALHFNDFNFFRNTFRNIGGFFNELFRDAEKTKRTSVMIPVIRFTQAFRNEIMQDLEKYKILDRNLLWVARHFHVFNLAIEIPGKADMWVNNETWDKMKEGLFVIKLPKIAAGQQAPQGAQHSPAFYAPEGKAALAPTKVDMTSFYNKFDHFAAPYKNPRTETDESKFINHFSEKLNALKTQNAAPVIVLSLLQTYSTQVTLNATARGSKFDSNEKIRKMLLDLIKDLLPIVSPAPVVEKRGGLFPPIR